MVGTLAAPPTSERHTKVLLAGTQEVRQWLNIKWKAAARPNTSHYTF